MAEADEKDVVTIDKWLGLRNTVRPEAFSLGDLDAATNVDIDDALKLRMRRGYTTTAFTESYHSLFAASDVMVGVTGSTLHRLFPNGTRTALRTDLSGARLSCTAAGGRIYYTDGVTTGCVDAGVHRSWGIAPPSSQPVATATGGALRAGTYQYAVTYVRADGQPSGTGLAGSITLAAAGGIAFNAIPVSSDPAVTAKHLYISPVDGDMLFRQMVLPAAATSASYMVDAMGDKPLDTQFLQPPVAGQLLASGLGFVYVARGRRLYRTEAYRFELMDLRKSYLFGGPINLLAPVDDGMWVGAGSELIFLEGAEPAKWDYRPKASYGPIAGALCYGDAEDIDPALDGPAALVGTTRGVVACLNGGIMKNLTKERFSYPTTERGAAVVRNHGGMTQYLMVLEGTEGASNAAS
jgi:hypothetical protein